VVRDDCQVVAAVLDGDQAAFGELYDRYAPLVRSVCYDATGDLTEAQDLAQEVFLRAYRRLGTLRDPAQVGPWLVGIARRVGLEWRRRMGRRRERFGLAGDDLPAAETDDVHGRLEALEGALRRLPRRERLAIHAFYLDGEAVGAARQALRLSRSGFYRVLQRARERLARLMDKD